MKKVLPKISYTLMVVGSLNWGLVGLFDFNLVQFLFHSWSPILERIVYSLVGLAGAHGLALMTGIVKCEYNSSKK